MTIRKVIIECRDDDLSYVRIGDDGVAHLISQSQISDVIASPQTVQSRAYGHIDYTVSSGERKRVSMTTVGQIVTIGPEVDCP